MPFGERYNDLNRRCKAAIEEAERLGRELGYYTDDVVNSDPVTRIDPARLAEMRGSLPGVLAGLADPDPKVRLAAVSLFGTKRSPKVLALVPGIRQPDYEYPPEAAAAMLALATSDSDEKVRQHALGAVPYFYCGTRRDRTVEKRLAEIALETDDVITRHLVFHGLIRMSGVPFWFLMSPKYLGLPVVFDEFYVQCFLDPDTAPDTPRPPNPVPPPRRWWPFGKR